MVDVYFRPAFVERGGRWEEEEEERRGNKSGIPPPWKTGEGREWSGNFEGVSVSVSRLVKFDRIIMLLYGNRIENRSVFRNEGRRKLVRLDEIISFFFPISVFRDFVFGDFLFFFFFLEMFNSV